jgi:hypothetical protein
MYTGIVLLFIDGKGAVYSRDPSTVNKPVARLNKTYFFEEISIGSIREILLTNRIQGKASKVIFVVFLCAKHSLFIGYKALLVHRRQPRHKYLLSLLVGLCV